MQSRIDAHKMRDDHCYALAVSSHEAHMSCPTDHAGLSWGRHPNIANSCGQHSAYSPTAISPKLDQSSGIIVENTGCAKISQSSESTPQLERVFRHIMCNGDCYRKSPSRQGDETYRRTWIFA